MDPNSISSIVSILSTVLGALGIATRLAKGFATQSKVTNALLAKIDRLSQDVEKLSTRLNEKVDNLDRRLSHLEVDKENMDLVNIPSWLK